jgi:hypothetical protein
MAKTITKTLLNMSAPNEKFFSDIALIGIVAAMPGYHLCWLLNKHLGTCFRRDPDQNIPMQKKDNQYNFPIYQHTFPNCSNKYVLYKLKNGAETLLPETKQLDYLLYLQTIDPEEDAWFLAAALKNMPDIQLAQIIDPDQLKNLNNLLL